MPTTSTASAVLDPFDGRSPTAFVTTMVGAGAVATVAFDVFGQALSPLLGFASLAPVPLATQVWQVLTGTTVPAMGHLLHYVVGLVGYPLGWMVVEVLRRAYVPALPWLVAATLYGVALWVFALLVMASWVAGNPPFLGFAGITWVALAGHVLFALVAADVVRRRDRRD